MATGYRYEDFVIADITDLSDSVFEMDALRNFKDFLLIFNKMSETCFTRCVNTFQTRELTEDEDRCVEMCSSKNIRVNHKIMSVYMEVQPLIVQKRVEEMEKLNPPITPTVPEVAEINTVAQIATLTETEPQIVLQETSSTEAQVV